MIGVNECCFNLFHRRGSDELYMEGDSKLCEVRVLTEAVKEKLGSSCRVAYVRIVR